jgi:Leucine-rich repeat (LRR) protein
LNFNKSGTDRVGHFFAGDKNNNFFKLEDNIFVKFGELKYLFLQDCNIHEVSEGAFNRLSNLTKLYLHINKIKHLHGRVFASLKSLEHLDLFSNQIERIPNDIFQPLLKLKELDLRHNQIYSIDQESFKSLTSIISIKLKDNICITKDFGNNNSHLDLAIVDDYLSACYNNYKFKISINESSTTTTNGKFIIESSGFVTVLVILIAFEVFTATMVKLFLVIHIALDQSTIFNME